jgi:hypothetical protein
MLYAMICRLTGKLVKIGLTRDLESRKGYYDDDGRDQYHFVPFLKLRHLEKEMDSFLQERYRALVEAIRTNEATPKPVRKLFEMIDKRGAEYFGVKGNVIDRMVEVGAQLHYGLSVPGEVYMCSATVFDSRKRWVEEAAGIIQSHVDTFLDTTKTIDIQIVTSWNTGYYQPRDDNPHGKLFNAQAFVEYITSCIIDDLREHGTLPAPAKRNATTDEEAFRLTTRKKPWTKDVRVWTNSFAR